MLIVCGPLNEYNTSESNPNPSRRTKRIFFFYCTVVMSFSISNDLNIVEQTNGGAWDGIPSGQVKLNAHFHSFRISYK